MKILFMFLTSGLILVGCAAETPYIDHEFGTATRNAFDRQIVHQDYRYADKQVEGLPGIHSEKVMQTYHNTFSESFTQENIDITATGN